MQPSVVPARYTISGCVVLKPSIVLTQDAAIRPKVIALQRGRCCVLRFRALSRLRAAGSAAALGRRADARSVSVRSAPARLAFDKSAPARSARLRLQFARLAFCSFANLRSVRERLAPFRSAFLRSADVSTPRIRPIDWLRM